MQYLFDSTLANLLEAMEIDKVVETGQNSVTFSIVSSGIRPFGIELTDAAKKARSPGKTKAALHPLQF
jgi:hypothetical protein